LKLIRSVEVERFRSCESIRLEDLGDVTAFVGPNNSGKSNVLRALNLFFNDETDPGSFVNFDVDYRLGPPSKKKKSIRVSVEFSLPDKFQFRKGLEAVEQLVRRDFWIRKTWTLDLFEPIVEICRPGSQFRRVVGEESDRVTQFLNLISFRYVPNRAIPAQVIREQSRGVLRQLARRLLARGGRDVAPMLESMTLVAKEMVAPIAADLTRVCAGMSDLELSTPASVFDLLGQAGFRAGVGTFGRVEDTSLGSGVQSILMFHVLYMIDQGQFQGFGWRQAAIWAVEEPESSLHRQLQARLAVLLRAYALPGGSRFQILVTTHNDVFVYGATAGFLVTLDDSPSTAIERRPILELAREAASQRVTVVPNPALQFPFDTVVLTEGDIDAKVLARAADVMRMCQGVRFATPSQLDPSLEGDGLEAITRFVRNHRYVIPQRLSGHPLLVLVDWEVPDERVRQIAARYGDGGTVNVRRMASSWADPLVGDSFKGIERFYPVSFLERAEQESIIALARRGDGELVVTPKDLRNAKAALAELFCQTATEPDCQGFRPVLRWVESVRSGALL
jgi:predicted ATPase